MASERPKGGNDERRKAEDFVELGPRTSYAERRAIAKESLAEHRLELLRIVKGRMGGNLREEAEQPEDIIAAVVSALLAGETRFRGSEGEAPGVSIRGCAGGRRRSRLTATSGWWIWMGSRHRSLRPAAILC